MSASIYQKHRFIICPSPSSKGKVKRRRQERKQRKMEVQITDQESSGSTEQLLLSPPLISLSSSASVAAHSFLSCSHVSPPSPICCLSPPRSVIPSSHPRSPARSCGIREGLLGLVSLQCRGGQDGCFSTMR